MGLLNTYLSTWGRETTLATVWGEGGKNDVKKTAVWAYTTFVSFHLANNQAEQQADWRAHCGDDVDGRYLFCFVQQTALANHVCDTRSYPCARKFHW